MFTDKILTLLIIIQNVIGFSPIMSSYNLCISRRDILKTIVISNTLYYINKPSLCFSNELENRPLTSEEIKEYNNLLKEAEKIKSIIKANKDALIDINEENGIEIYLKKNNITIIK